MTRSIKTDFSKFLVNTPTDESNAVAGGKTDDHILQKNISSPDLYII